MSEEYGISWIRRRAERVCVEFKSIEVLGIDDVLEARVIQRQHKEHYTLRTIPCVMKGPINLCSTLLSGPDLRDKILDISKQCLWPLHSRKMPSTLVLLIPNQLPRRLNPRTRNGRQFFGKPREP
jgi:hypothetical protein